MWTLNFDIKFQLRIASYSTNGMVIYDSIIFVDVCIARDYLTFVLAVNW